MKGWRARAKLRNAEGEGWLQRGKAGGEGGQRGNGKKSWGEKDFLFSRFSTAGGIDKISALCLLPLNIINEKENLQLQTINSLPKMKIKNIVVDVFTWCNYHNFQWNNYVEFLFNFSKFVAK
jgi:hypothetical protein